MQLKERIRNYWRANTQAVYLVGDEGNRYIDAITEVAQELTEERQSANQNQKKKDVRPIRVFCHDKVAGIYAGSRPGMSGGPSTKPLVALKLMLQSDIELSGPNEGKLLETIGLKPEDDIIFILKDWENVFSKPDDGPEVIQQIRNAIHTNRMSGSFYEPGESGSYDQGRRGKRMLVFISSIEKLPPTLPELKPVVIPLPSVDELRVVADRVFDGLEQVHKASKGAKGCLTPPEARKHITGSLLGFTVQAAEDALTLAIAKLRSTNDVEAILEIIEEEKADKIRGIPGLQYINKSMLRGKELPGYEALIQFVKNRTSLPPEVYAKHNLRALRGIGIVGRPGLGKTIVGMLLGTILNRPLLLWNMGESKGGIVGASEANTRRVLQIAQIIDAVVLVDDVDKSMMAGQPGSYQGDGGTSGNMVQMLLTEMSAPWNRAVWVLTMNRIQNLPPELLRKGRLDEIFFVQAPDPETRQAIAKSHITRRNFKVTDEDLPKLQEFASEVTMDWTGAEIEAIVESTAFKSLTGGSDRFDFDALITDARSVIPMAKNPTFIEDIKAMEQAAAQFVKIGRTNNPTATTTPLGKARRSIMD